MSAVIDCVLAVLVLGGTLLLFSAGVGLLRGINPFARIQSVAKSGAVGAVFLLLCVAVAAGDFAIFMRAVAAAAIVLVNAAFMAQVLAEAAQGSASGPTTNSEKT